jgi:tetratricopeptide (TPR) repeat protein
MLAHLFFFKKDYDNAILNFKKYLRDFPRYTENLSFFWDSYETTWNYKEAEMYYKKVLDIEPYNNDIKQKIEKLESPK